MIKDDGDIVRGLGFVVMHAAHLEGQIDDLLLQLAVIELYSEEERKLPVSKKIKKAKNIFSKIDDPFSSEMFEELEVCREHFEWRNELVHGRIYSPEYHEKNLKSSRANVPDRRAESPELYELANKLVILNGRISWPITLPNFIAKVLTTNA